MSQHCKANPCCGDVPCSGIPLPQHASGLPSHNKSIRAAVVSGPPLLPMTAERAIYFLERFKRDEKMLGPNEQLALDFAINAIAAAPQPNPSKVDAGWQPIETAPKDGTRFLASVLNDVAVLHWHGSQKKGCWHDENTAFGYGANLPTHWCPLPPAPALAAQGEKQP